ncbi:MAG TPA: hypothetical protein VMW36_11485 [Patescibacteria group bacterium]|nr:hypothetical protein [Patescibacteria group bacterium]
MKLYTYTDEDLRCAIQYFYNCKKKRKPVKDPDGWLVHDLAQGRCDQRTKTVVWPRECQRALNLAHDTECIPLQVSDENLRNHIANQQLIERIRSGEITKRNTTDRLAEKAREKEKRAATIQTRQQKEKQTELDRQIELADAHAAIERWNKVVAERKEAAREKTTEELAKAKGLFVGPIKLSDFQYDAAKGRSCCEGEYYCVEDFVEHDTYGRQLVHAALRDIAETPRRLGKRTRWFNRQWMHSDDMTAAELRKAVRLY